MPVEFAVVCFFCYICSANVFYIDMKAKQSAVCSTRKVLTAFLLIVAGGIRTFAGSDELTMIVGTYTDESSSDGMYIYRFNQKTGTSQLVGDVHADNPSFLVVNDEGNRVYAVSEYDDGRQGIGAFTLDVADGKLNPIGFQKCGTKATRTGNLMPGAAPCNVMLYDGHVVTSNYNGGDISVFPLDDDGDIAAESQYFDMYREQNGVASHIHCCKMTSDKKYMMANDLGNDCIWRFSVDSGNEFLSSPVIAYQAPKGTGPRHLVFNREGSVAYLVGELDGSVTVLAYKDGALRELQRIQASKTRTAGSADIHLSPDGRFLYASHRLTDEGLSVFAVDRHSGMLTKVGFQSTAAHPRNFAITPNGHFVLVACRDSNVIQVYRRNRKTGMLDNTGKNISLGKPVCVQFVAK